LRALGVFTGAELASDSTVPPPFAHRWVLAEGDGNSFRDEIRATFLHELGHFLRLDEDDLAERGLE